MNCWNCLGNHGIRDCPVSRNPMEIAKNRKEFQTRSGPKNNRYHVDNEQRFGYIVPGKISSNLKRALGIRENELPNHIYRYLDDKNFFPARFRSRDLEIIVDQRCANCIGIS